MSNSPLMEELNARLRKEQSTPEYQIACQRFRAECDRLSELAAQLQKQELEAYCIENTVRMELAFGSTLHRGFYCPSPVYDILVGNVKRGKIQKRVFPGIKPSHEYGFDHMGRLVWCKTYGNKKLAYTEYLIYQDNRIWGIMIAPGGEVRSITEEVYENGRIVSYLYGLFSFPADPVKCYELTSEYYFYDDQGICETHWHRYMQPPEKLPAFLNSDWLPQCPIYRCVKYRFQRKDGYLSGVTDENGPTYPIKIKRKA